MYCKICETDHDNAVFYAKRGDLEYNGRTIQGISGKICVNCGFADMKEDIEQLLDYELLDSRVCATAKKLKELENLLPCEVLNTIWEFTFGNYLESEGKSGVGIDVEDREFYG